MITEFVPIVRGIQSLIDEWEPKLLALKGDIVTQRRNSQNRTIKQIAGHMIDSASNNTHRIIHLQYQKNPLNYPNYASNGNNDRWIAIQNYQEEDWNGIVQLLKYSNYHLIHVIENINASKLYNAWAASPEKNISLKTMVIDYLRHMELHFSEINDLINL
ncbi:MAG: DinB family protein [Bacteroidales bacterium]|nr:DinB family protein [Bacteroidales bacterium]